MGKIFIAGATGNIGSALVDSLENKEDIIAGVHSTEKGECLAAEGVETRVFDFNDMDSMISAMDGCDRMFLVIPLHEKMARFGRLAVDAAMNSGIEYIVRSSGYGASSDAHWRLGRELGMVDQFVEDSKIPYTTLRPNSFMQNFTSHYLDMVKSGTIALPEKEHSVSYIDVRDIADCAARLLVDNVGFENAYYALTGPEGLTLTQVAEQISAVRGEEVTYTAVAEERFMDDLKGAGVPEWNMNMLVSLTRVVKLGMMGNVTQAVKYLTESPARSFADFTVENREVWK